MKIQYLGTAAAEAFPGIFCSCDFCKQARKNGGKDIRTRSQAIIDDKLLIDFPADSYSHAINYNVDLTSINSLLITHTHNDHFYLEDLGLRFEAFCHDLKGELTLYGNRTMKEKFAKTYESDPNDTHLKGLLAARVIKPFETTVIEGYSVTPLPADHDKSEECYIYYIEKDGKSLLYGNDTGWFPQATWDFIGTKHLNLVSLDCTLLKYRVEQNHMGIPNVLEVKARLNELNCVDGNTKFVVTHFSHNGHLLHGEIVEMLKPHQIEVAYDGFVVEF